MCVGGSGRAGREYIGRIVFIYSLSDTNSLLSTVLKVWPTAMSSFTKLAILVHPYVAPCRTNASASLNVLMVMYRADIFFSVNFNKFRLLIIPLV